MTDDRRTRVIDTPVDAPGDEYQRSEYHDDDWYDDDQYDDDQYDGEPDDPGATRRGPHRSPRRSAARRRRLIVIVLAVLVVAVALSWVVAFTSLFGVRSVDVRGNHVLTSAQIAAAADIGTGTPLVRVDTAAAARRVEGLAEIRSAQISTSFPSTVVITVAERTPVGFIHRNGRATLVDATGLQYRTVASAPNGLPRFVLPTGDGARAAGVAVATVAAAMPGTLRAHVDSIEALDPGAITVVLSHGQIVRWGSSARSTDKSRVLNALRQTSDGHIDVTNPDLPYTH